eukprot:561425-Karenia_brevis.AAC.1
MELVSMLLMLQLVPTVQVHVNPCMGNFNIYHRTAGGLTGSRLAGLAGQIPVAHAFVNLRDKLMPLGWQLRAKAEQCISDIYGCGWDQAPAILDPEAKTIF